MKLYQIKIIDYRSFQVFVYIKGFGCGGRFLHARNIKGILEEVELEFE